MPLLHPPAPKGARDVEFQDQLRALAPDVIVVASFGELLDQSFLDLALVLNVHGSLLPRHRGASPVQAALLAGDTETGVSIQRVVLALDAGDVLLAKRCAIQPDDTAGAMFDRLAQLGAEALLEALARLETDAATSTPQDPAQITHCKKLQKDAGHVDWDRTSAELERLVRAMSPWPAAFTELEDGRVLKIHRASIAERPGPNDDSPAPGMVLEAGSRLLVATRDGALDLSEVQLAGKRALTAAEFLRGQRLEPGTQLGCR